LTSEGYAPVPQVICWQFQFMLDHQHRRPNIPQRGPAPLDGDTVAGGAEAIQSPITATADLELVVCVDGAFPLTRTPPTRRPEMEARAAVLGPSIDFIIPVDLYFSSPPPYALRVSLFPSLVSLPTAPSTSPRLD